MIREIAANDMELPVKQGNKGIITVFLLVSLSIIFIDEWNLATLSRSHQLIAGNFCSLAQFICLGREFSQHITLKHNSSFPQNPGYYAVITIWASQLRDLPCFVEVSPVSVSI
jgi:hypothetical protein